MARYFLDTNTCIDAWQRGHAGVIARMRQARLGELVVPTLVAAELASGVMHSARREQNRAVIETALSLVAVEPWGAEAIWLYGQQWARMRRAGNMIGAIDLLIGCQALADPEGILVTHNVREFQCIEGLRVEDWAAA